MLLDWSCYETQRNDGRESEREAGEMKRNDPQEAQAALESSVKLNPVAVCAECCCQAPDCCFNATSLPPGSFQDFVLDLVRSARTHLLHPCTPIRASRSCDPDPLIVPCTKT